MTIFRIVGPFKLLSLFTLHLMNRLNLPAPFCDANEFPGSLFVLTNEEVNECGAKSKLEEMEVSSGAESEMSDGSIDDQVRNQPSLELKALRKPSKLKSGILKLQKRRFDFRGKALRPTPVGGFNSAKMSTSSKSELSDEPVFEKTKLRPTPLIKLQIKDVKPAVSNTQSDADAQTEGFGVFSAEERTSNPQSTGSPLILFDIILITIYPSVKVASSITELRKYVTQKN